MVLLQDKVSGVFLKAREAILFNQAMVFLEAKVACVLMETREVMVAKGLRDNMEDSSPKDGCQD